MKRRVETSSQHYDVLVVGSGFGGSVAALRLTEKGYRVGVLEAGRRWEDEDFAKNTWDVKPYMWAPKLGLKGIQRIHLLPDVLVLAGAGVGGGSLVYSNVLYEPKSDSFYTDQQWAHITDWRDELAPYYDQAKRMLGRVDCPALTDVDRLARKVAAEMGVERSFELTPVGVYFGRNGRQEPGLEAEDPFFGGMGPRRTGCIECGECMTGCRHGAKNTLVKNYLHLAEMAGAAIHPERTVTAVRPLPAGGYRVDTSRTGSLRRRIGDRSFAADHVVIAAGTWGTQQLLHRMKADGVLPHLSERLGALSRTNSESIGSVTAKWRHRKHFDFTRGATLTSSFQPDEHTLVEPFRYGKGLNMVGLVMTVASRGGGGHRHWVRWLTAAARHPGQLLSLYGGINQWSQRSITTVTMQDLDNSITLYPKRGAFGRWKVTSKQGEGAPNPTSIPVAVEVLQRMATHIDGFTVNGVSEIFGIPMTAHFLGGCTIGDGPETGVVDPYHRVYGHPGLHIADGSTISANLGVNPSLSITALSERAMSFWPNKGDSDPRPALGAAYQRLNPVAPRAPVVPATAPGALRLSIDQPSTKEIH
jgi:cholesterol oxidase